MNRRSAIAVLTVLAVVWTGATVLAFVEMARTPDAVGSNTNHPMLAYGFGALIGLLGILLGAALLVQAAVKSLRRKP